MFSTLVNDEQVQRKGVVMAGYMVSGGGSDGTKQDNFLLLQEKNRLQSSMPIKVACQHACTNDPFIGLLVKACKPFMSTRLMSRTRIHCGKFCCFCFFFSSNVVMASARVYFTGLSSLKLLTLDIDCCPFLFESIILGNHLETQYELLSFGFPLIALPVDSTGTCTTEFHELWIKKRQQKEKAEQQQRRALTPPKPASVDLAMQLKPATMNSLANGASAIPNVAASSAAAVPATVDDTFDVNLEDADWLEEADDIDGRSGDEAVLSVSWDEQMTSTVQPSPQACASPSTVLPTDDESVEKILKPLVTDCLLGRGKAIDHHVGNIKFREYLKQDNLLQKYHSLKRHTKGKMAETIHKILEEDYHIRFLKGHPSGNGWILADKTSVREKIARTFRRVIKQQKQQQQQKKGQ